EVAHHECAGDAELSGGTRQVAQRPRRADLEHADRVVAIARAAVVGAEGDRRLLIDEQLKELAERGCHLVGAFLRSPTAKPVAARIDGLAGGGGDALRPLDDGERDTGRVMSEANVGGGREIIVAFNSHDIGLILAAADPDFEVEVPPDLSAEPDTYRGHDGMR